MKRPEVRRDFIQLHKEMPEHAGIIVCSQDADVQGQAGRIHLAIQNEDILAGKLIRVHRAQL
jgi:hypothetical protein